MNRIGASNTRNKRKSKQFDQNQKEQPSEKSLAPYLLRGLLQINTNSNEKPTIK
jgi:hypothetical protein